MRKFRKLMAVSFVAAAMMALPAVLPGSDAEAASTKDDSSSASSKDASFERGQQAFRDGDWEGAVGYFKKTVADDAKNAEAYNLMGYSYRRMGQADPAFKAYAMALDIDPRHRGANEYLGETYLLVGDVEKANGQLALLKDLCGNQCKETVKLRKAIERYNASADKQALLGLDEENW
ncbi:MAG: tetratricopeptide repeat protein [Rhodospirillaceae bacterium]|nr:tetratricopeptide repeat protein [Rhodospirillaceae bacterium]MBT3925930.1 tetratricopeptide repeat protein [Rhodospirillaceae bacterium]